jgi:hypothetical protein
MFAMLEFIDLVTDVFGVQSVLLGLASILLFGPVGLLGVVALILWHLQGYSTASF